MSREKKLKAMRKKLDLNRWTRFQENEDLRVHHSEESMWEYQYWNNRYTVAKYVYERECMPTVIHLSIHDHERSVTHDWRDYQKIKNELIGPEEECVEIYPAESRLVDTSNEYHMWCIQGFKFTDKFGFKQRWVAEVSEVRGRSKQRPFRNFERPNDLTVITKEDLLKQAGGHKAKVNRMIRDDEKKDV